MVSTLPGPQVAHGVVLGLGGVSGDGGLADCPGEELAAAGRAA